LLVGKVQQDARQLILHIWRKGADALDGLFQKVCHTPLCPEIPPGKREKTRFAKRRQRALPPVAAADCRIEISQPDHQHHG
jgi:hypothetical protein